MGTARWNGRLRRRLVGPAVDSTDASWSGLRADDKYTCVQSAGGEHLIRMTIADLNAQLDPAQFWQVHRSM